MEIALLQVDILKWFAAILAIAVIYLVKQWILSYISPLSKIPGPPTWSPLGHINILLTEPPGDPFIKWGQQYGSIIRYFFPLYNQRIAIVDPEYIKHVLITQCSKYIKPTHSKNFLVDSIGEGLVLLEGQKHAKARRIINPTFKYNKIKELVPVFQSFAQSLINYWQNEINNSGGQKAALEVDKDFNRLTLDIICKCAFDFNCNAIADENNAVTNAFAEVLGGLNFNWTYFIPGLKYLPTPSNLEGRRALSICHGTITKVIKDKIDKGVTGEEKCMLDILLSLKDEETNTGFTNKELQDHVMTFMTAGHETTSVTLAWTLYALANNPEIQNKVRQEISKVIQPGDEVTWDTFDKLSYLDNVIKESLRLYPPVPSTVRQALVDDQIGGYVIPKGTIVTILPPYRSSKYFEEPLKFDPDRWDSTAKNTSPYIYLPFLRGPRMCIGAKFAITELKCILSLVLSNFSFQPFPDREVKRKLFITMRPHPSLKLIVSTLDS